MTDIKFRFWLGHTKKMTHDHSLIEIAHLHWDFTEDIIALQFTGLLDKNKKEIYKGDIIKARFWHNNPPSKRPKQKFIEVNLAVVFEDGSFQPDDSAIRSTEYGTTYNQWWGDNCEVIGNIYENPELLKLTAA